MAEENRAGNRTRMGPKTSQQVKTQLPEGENNNPAAGNLSRLNKTINNEILKDNYMPLRSGVCIATVSGFNTCNAQTIKAKQNDKR